MNKKRGGIAITVEEILENNPEEDLVEVASVKLYELLVKHVSVEDTWRILESKQTGKNEL